MGEVWQARDLRFESRLVAVKILQEDQNLRDDARDRQRFLLAVEQESRSGTVTPSFLVNALSDLLSSAGDRQQLLARVQSVAGTSSITAAVAAAVFDQIADNPLFNERARIRAKMRKLFRDEANSVATLDQENIVSISDDGDYGGVPYLVMEYIEGQTVARLIQAGAAVSRTRQLRLMEDLCAGLGYAHRKNLVHRDIKPANLIVDAGTDRLKILDFGVVRRLEHAGDSTVGIAVGTFCYMSPEQTVGSATLDHRSDIFSVGAVFYELLSGQKAFPPGDSAIELVTRVRTGTPAPLATLVPGLEPEIDQIIDRALAKSPDDRYPTLAPMQRELEQLRTRLELVEEQDERTNLRPLPDPTVLMRPAPADPLVLDRLRQAEETRPAEEATQAEAAPETEASREAEAVRQAEAAREAEFAREAAFAREAEAAREAEFAREAAFAREAEAAREAEFAREAEAARLPPPRP